MPMETRRLKAPAINPAFARFPLRIDRSRVHGFGVFTLAAIPAGRRVIEYTGERLRSRQAAARRRRLLAPGRPKRIYMFQVSRTWFIDGAVGGSGAERVNHCCDPNLSVRIIRGHIYYYSRRGIRPGEELSLDYHLSPKTFRIRCHCGSLNCRGFLNLKKE